MVANSADGVQIPLSERSVHVLRRLVSIWEEVAETEVPVLEDRDWERGVSARVQIEHAVGLTRAVLVLADSGLRIESVPLVRLTMECAVTAVWLMITSGSGKASSHQAAVDFRELNLALLKIENKATDHEADLKVINAEIEALESCRRVARKSVGRRESNHHGERVEITAVQLLDRILADDSSSGANLVLGEEQVDGLAHELALLLARLFFELLESGKVGVRDTTADGGGFTTPGAHSWPPGPERPL